MPAGSIADTRVSCEGFLAIFDDTAFAIADAGTGDAVVEPPGASPLVVAAVPLVVDVDVDVVDEPLPCVLASALPCVLVDPDPVVVVEPDPVVVVAPDP